LIDNGHGTTIIAIFAGAIMISFPIAFGLMFQAHASLTPEQKAAAKREVDNVAGRTRWWRRLQ
jgi:hypothetical protein